MKKRFKYKHKAFISYKHSDISRTQAIALESSLKRYAKHFLKPPISIFRDEKQMVASNNLDKLIKDGLKNSEYLLFLAEKSAAESVWVQDEIKYWCDDLKRLDKFIIDDITTDDIQDLVNWMIAQGKSASTIGLIKPVLKPLLAVNDVLLNWKKIEFPKVDNERKYKGTDDEAKLIAKTLLGYKHPVARGVFTFLLTGRRIGEIMQMEYSHLDYSSNSFTLPKETTKTNTEVTYGLTPELINAINIQKTTTGLIFDLKAISVHYHFKKAMQSIGIHNMVMHDIRSMVAVVSLRNGADIYSVSKMLSHKDLSTTQKRYIGNDVSQAAAAQDTFTAVIAPVVDVIDVDVVDDEFTALKAIYPTATDDKIQQVMEMMK